MMKMQQVVLDTLAHLPNLKMLRLHIIDNPAWEAELTNFKPSQGRRYVGELEIDKRWYVLERDGGQHVKYRECWYEGM
jgi:hypothetical protein